MKYIFLTTCAALMALSSCKKEEPTTNNTNTPTHIGTWVGKYGSSTSAPTSTYAFIFADGGTMQAFDGLPNVGSKATGTFWVSGDSIKGSYTYDFGGSKYYFACKINASKTLLTGTWGADVSAATGGTFFMGKE